MATTKSLFPVYCTCTAPKIGRIRESVEDTDITAAPGRSRFCIVITYYKKLSVKTTFTIQNVSPKQHRHRPDSCNVRENGVVHSNLVHALWFNSTHGVFPDDGKFKSKSGQVGTERRENCLNASIANAGTVPFSLTTQHPQRTHSRRKTRIWRNRTEMIWISAIYQERNECHC